MTLMNNGFRMVNLPWADGQMPAGAMRTATLHYQGGTTTTIAGSGQMTIPGSITMTKVANGPNWIEYLHTYYQAPYGPQPAQRQEAPQVWGAAMIGGAWIDPRQFAELSPDQQIDLDPVTGAKLGVTYKGPGSGGRPVLTLIEQAHRYSATWTYDQTNGVMLSVRLFHPGPMGSTLYAYFLTGMQ